ncbi:hypothetical protein AB1N83_004824 [Pleurotus pulmonarius]
MSMLLFGLKYDSELIGRKGNSTWLQEIIAFSRTPASCTRIINTKCCGHQITPSSQSHCLSQSVTSEQNACVMTRVIL